MTDPTYSSITQEQHRQNELVQNLMAGTPRIFVVWVIIGLNIAAYIVTGLRAGWFDPDPAKMLSLGADYWALTMAGQYWRLFTSAFLHFGLIHLLANMYALMSVGPLAERLFGNVFFTVLYLFAAVLSGLASVWWDRHAVSAGASGAIFAVYGAVISFVVIHRSAFSTAAARSILQGMAVFVGYNVLYGLSQKGISNSGHLGGLFAGLVLGALMARPVDLTRRKSQTHLRMAAGLLVGCAAVALSMVLIPKSAIDIKAEQNFKAARDAMIADEEKVVDLTNNLWTLVRQNTLDDAAMAKRLDNEVIPMWDTMVKRFEAAPIADGSPTRELYDVLTAYTRAQREAYTSLSKGLKTGDDAAIKHYELKLKQAQGLAKAMKNAFQKSLPL